MTAYIILGTVLVLITICGGAGGGYLLGRQRRKAPQHVTAGPEEAIPSALYQAVTELGERLQSLDFTPSPSADGKASADYHAALTAYDQAASDRSEQVVRAALAAGHAALVRLDARLAGQPVPIEAMPPEFFGADLPPAVPGLRPTAPAPSPPPASPTGERFLHTGSGPAVRELLIDRPEPGRPAIAEVVTSGGDGVFDLMPIIRTEDRVERSPGWLPSFSEVQPSGRLLIPEVHTHLRAEEPWGKRSWSVRIRPVSSAPELREGMGGTGPEVVRYEGGPSVLSFQARGEAGWSVKFYCPRSVGEPPRPLAEPGECTCDVPEEARAAVEDTGSWISGRGDGKQPFLVPHAGWISVNVYGDRSDELPFRWSLQVARRFGGPGGGRDADRLGSTADSAVDDRFVHTGSLPEKREIPIERPEPGRPAIADVLTTRGHGQLYLSLLQRTPERIRRDEPGHSCFDRRTPGGRILLPEIHTHLVAEVHSRDWLLRVRPVSEAPVLEESLQGEGSDVVRYEGGPAVAAFQVSTDENWEARLYCPHAIGRPLQEWDQPGECQCETPASLRGTGAGDDLPYAFGLGEGKARFPLPHSGWIVVTATDGGRWSLRASPRPEAVRPD